MKSLQEALSQLPGLERALAQLGSEVPLTPTFTCTGCEDRGVITYSVPINHSFFGKLFACPDCARGRGMLVEQWKRRLSQIQLPPLYQRLTFDTWAELPDELKADKRLAYTAALLFVQTEGCCVDLAEAYRRAGRRLESALVRRSLVFQGTYGIGKTGLAAAIVNELAARHETVLYIRTDDFLDSVKLRFGKEDPTAEEVVHSVRCAPVLVIDEFNMSKAENNDWRKEQVEKVIRYRYMHDLPTIVTCNAGKEDLTNQWGARTVHALLAMAHFIPMGGRVLRDVRQIEEVF